MGSNPQPTPALPSAKPDLTFQEETVAGGSAAPEFMGLIAANWAELERHKGARPLVPNLAAYDALYRAGKLKVYTARCDGALVGYATFFLTSALRCDKHVLHALSDLWYLAAEHRRADNAVRMLRFVEDSLRELGVLALYMVDPHQKPIAPLLQWAGYKPIETTYEKVLTKEYSAGIKSTPPPQATQRNRSERAPTR